MFRANSEDGHRRLRTPVRSPGRGEKPPCLETPASARACELATLVLDCRAEGWPAMNDLSAFDGDAERERQICDLRIRGKTEAEVCQMLGCTVPDIHRRWIVRRRRR